MFSLRSQLLRSAALAAMASASIAAQASDAEALKNCVTANLPDQTLVANVEIESFDAAGGSQSLKARMWSRRTDNFVSVNVRIDGPPDLAGASYLLLERDGRDDVYMFLPALNRVRRMTGQAASKAMWGTDFSYEDMRQLRAVTGDGRLTLLEDQQQGERLLRGLSLSLADIEESPYERIDFRIDSETCVPLQVDFFETGGKARKQLTAAFDKLVQVQGRWAATEFLMRDLRDNTRTTLKLSDLRYDETLSGRVFNPRMFHLGG